MLGLQCPLLSAVRLSCTLRMLSKLQKGTVTCKIMRFGIECECISSGKPKSLVSPLRTVRECGAQCVKTVGFLAKMIPATNKQDHRMKQKQNLVLCPMRTLTSLGYPRRAIFHSSPKLNRALIQIPLRLLAESQRVQRHLRRRPVQLRPSSSKIPFHLSLQILL